jgi:sec-independent protein translocase protein TatB
MFNIGFWELFLIVVIGLLLVGPKQLPEVAKTVSKAMRKLRRTGDELRDSARQVVEEVIPPEDLYGYGDDNPKLPPAAAQPYLPSPQPETKPDDAEKPPEDGDSSLAS